ncbi:hypothetical protein SDC9_04154 [bioreactor metagenome]|uniref:HNH nuclease domain-containing protein n=1 Tax=bioreactor metagenome TaxID=1076179 RepID=A0A644SV90_9ZZZZ
MIPKTPRIKNPKLIKQIRSIGYCEYCSSRFALQVHHIKTRGAGGNDTEDNLICLCYLCHGWAHDGLIRKEELREIVNKRGRDYNVD